MYNKILAADDEYIVLEVYKTLLSGKKEDFFQLKTFSDGRELLEHFREEYNRGNRIPLCILDMKMPVMDGFTTAREIRKIDPDVIIIIVTGYSDISLKDIKKNLKKDIYFFAKPFNSEEFYCLVGSLVKSWNRNFELKESEAKYRTLLESIPQKIFYKDAASVYISCNENYARDLNIKSFEIAGRSDYDFFPGEVAKKYIDDDRRIIASGITETIEEKYISHREEVWVQTVKTPVRNEYSEITGVLGIFRDISREKKAEEELRKFKTISDRANYGNAIVDLKGDIFYVNDVFAGMHGYLPEELYGKNLRVFHNQEQLPHVEKLLEILVREGCFTAEEVWHTRKDGSVFPALMNAFTINDEEKRPLFMTATAIDITKNKQAEHELARYREHLEELVEERTKELLLVNKKLEEEIFARSLTEKALKESEEKYRKLSREFQAILDTVPDNLTLQNADLQVLWANRSSALSLNKESSEVVGKHCYELWNNSSKPCSFCPVIKSFNSGQMEIEEMKTPDGRYWEVRAFPIIEGGRVLNVVELARNITEKKVLEEKLDIERKQLLSIFESINEAVYVSDLETYKILYANRHFKEMLGKDPVGGFCHKEFHGFDSPCDFCTNYMILKEKGKPYQWEYYNKNLDIYFMISDRIIKWPDGKDVRFEIAININKQKKSEAERLAAEEKIKASLEEKEVLLKEIHHRVKNNLQIISSLLNLQSKYTGDINTLDIFQDSKNRIRSMALIHEILYQSGDFSKINFSDYIQKLLNYIRRSYGIDVRITLNVEEIPLDMDRAMSCGLIINELVSNSFKYAFPEGRGEVWIDFYSENGKDFIIKIKDSGAGIPEDLDIYNTDSLGLQLVFNLVEQLDGMMEVCRTGGTMFTIRFPA